MNIKITYKKEVLGKSTENLIFFVDEKFNIQNLRKYISTSEFSFIKDLMKIKDDKKKIISFDISSKKKLF